MSELKAIGESIGSDWGTREHYEAAKRAILTNYDPQTEYKAGDLIYCRHCGGKKTLDMPKKNIYLKCACSCIENRAKHEKYEREQRERAAVYRTMNESVVPADCVNASFFDWNADGMADTTEEYLTGIERCEKFCLNFGQVQESGRGIWLYGVADTGKTYIAAAMLKTLQKNGVAAIFTTLSRIFAEIKATYNKNATDTEESVIDRYTAADCLIIDNFTGIESGKRRTDVFGAEKLTEIILRRYERKKPTVITARQSLKDLFIAGRVPNEIVDKMQNRLVPILLTGNQRRAVQAQIEF